MGWVWKERQSWRGSYRDEAGKQHTKSFKHDNLVDYRWRSTRTDAGLTHKLHDLRQ